MSTQTQSSADLAVKFLEKYATVIGTLDAIERKDRDFLLKYATVVGSPAAIDIVAPAPVAAISDDPGDGNPGDGNPGDGTVIDNVGGEELGGGDDDNE